MLLGLAVDTLQTLLGQVARYQGANIRSLPGTCQAADTFLSSRRPRAKLTSGQLDWHVPLSERFSERLSVAPTVGVDRLFGALHVGREKRGTPCALTFARPHFSDMTPLPAPSGLPSELTSFVGREADLALVSSRLAEHRLVTLVGPGAVGRPASASRSAGKPWRHPLAVCALWTCRASPTLTSCPVPS